MVKTGRPKSINPKKNQVRINMTDEEVEKLTKCAETLQTTKTEVINKGIDLVFKNIKK